MGYKDKFREKATSMGMAQITPSEMPLAQKVASILTTTEYELFVEIDRAMKAAGAAGVDVPQTMEERRDEILDLADALAEHRLEEWWFDRYGEQFLDDVDGARDHVGSSTSEWQDQIETWASMMRDRMPERFENMTDAQVADVYVSRRFGISLGEFANEVVEWSQPKHVRDIARRNLRQSIHCVGELADALEDEDVDIT